MKNLKSNQMRVLVAAGILTIILASAGLAAAQGPHHGKGMHKGMQKGMQKGMADCSAMSDGEFGPGHRIEMMAKKLDLSEKQLETIKKIHENNRKEVLEKRKELMRLRNEMQGEMLKDNPSEKTVLGLNDKMGALKTEMKALRLKTRLAVREELTADQRDQMLMMGGHGGKGGRKGHGGACGGFGGCDGPRHGGGMGQGMAPRSNPDCRFNK